MALVGDPPSSFDTIEPPATMNLVVYDLYLLSVIFTHVKDPIDACRLSHVCQLWRKLVNEAFCKVLFTAYQNSSVLSIIEPINHRERLS